MGKPKIAYHTITWDLDYGQLEQGVMDIAELGFKGWEVLDQSSVSRDWSRRHFFFGDVRPAIFQSDTNYLNWWAKLSRYQEKYGIPLTTVYFSGEWGSEYTKEQEIEAAEAVARLLKGMGASNLVVAGGMRKPGGNTAREYKAVGDSLNELARRCKAFSVKVSYHPHLDTMVETREQLDKFAAATDPSLIGLCIDPAHFAVRGEDVVDVYRTYVERVWYTHFKDVKGQNVTELVGPARYDTFAELGEGQIDFPSITRILLDHGYDGWITIELDRSTRTPKESAIMSKHYITDVLGLEV
jgi:inosose dehydratase